jgi:hypothetical protein
VKLTAVVSSWLGQGTVRYQSGHSLACRALQERDVSPY